MYVALQTTEDNTGGYLGKRPQLRILREGVVPWWRGNMTVTVYTTVGSRRCSRTTGGCSGEFQGNSVFSRQGSLQWKVFCLTSNGIILIFNTSKYSMGHPRSCNILFASLPNLNVSTPIEAISSARENKCAQADSILSIHIISTLVWL
jgi:hypothetical protein